MDKKKLMRKTRAELLEMLRKKGVKSDSGALKSDLVALLAAVEAGTVDMVKSPRRRRMRKARRPALKSQPKMSTSKSGQQVTIPAVAIPATDIPDYSSSKIAAQGKGSEKTPPDELPKAYGQNRIVAMVRDPQWIFVYWELTPGGVESARRKFDTEADGAKIALRVYDTTGLAFSGSNAKNFFDIEVGAADNWYINTATPHRSYCVDIGLLGLHGVYRTIARSNIVDTPRAEASDLLDDRWLSLKEEAENVPGLEGSVRFGESSLELQDPTASRR